MVSPPPPPPPFARCSGVSLRLAPQIPRQHVCCLRDGPNSTRTRSVACISMTSRWIALVGRYLAGGYDVSRGCRATQGSWKHLECFNFDSTSNQIKQSNGADAHLKKGRGCRSEERCLVTRINEDLLFFLLTIKWLLYPVFFLAGVLPRPASNSTLICGLNFQLRLKKTQREHKVIRQFKSHSIHTIPLWIHQEAGFPFAWLRNNMALNRHRLSLLSSR